MSTFGLLKDDSELHLMISKICLGAIFGAYVNVIDNGKVQSNTIKAKKKVWFKTKPTFSRFKNFIQLKDKVRSIK